MSLYLIRRVNQKDLLLRLGGDQNRRPGGIQLVGIIQSLVFFYVRVLNSGFNKTTVVPPFESSEHSIPRTVQVCYNVTKSEVRR